ncbi:hypothetical protein ABFA07_010375 [Porites harrisoni]
MNLLGIVALSILAVGYATDWEAGLKAEDLAIRRWRKGIRNSCVRLNEGAKCIKIGKPCPPGTEGCCDKFSCWKRNTRCCCPKPETTANPTTVPTTAEPTLEPTTVLRSDCHVVYDFEDQDLSTWNLTGDAFNNQPTYGDNPHAREEGRHSNHQGDYWIGTFENRPGPNYPAGGMQGEGPQGTMTSPSFLLYAKYLKFLIGAGCVEDDTPVHAQLLIDGQVVLEETPKSCIDKMTEKTWNIATYLGKNAQFRLVDNSSAFWGHINFDNLRQCQRMLIR